MHARAAFTICRAELRSDWRAKRLPASMFLVAVLTVVAFAFAGEAGSKTLGPPALWISLILATATGVSQKVTGWETSGIDTALRLSPAGGTSVYLGTFLSLAMWVGLTAVGAVALIGLLFDAPVLSHAPELGLLLLFGSAGLAAVGATLALTASGSRTSIGRVIPLCLLPTAGAIVALAGPTTGALLSTGGTDIWRPALALGSAALALVLVGVAASQGR